MTDKERELIELIRNSEDPAAALIKATEIIINFLEKVATDIQLRA
jgi:hypothetical protein